MITIIFIDYCCMFYIFHYRNYYCLDDKVQLREGPLKCYRLGVTTRSVPACTVGDTEQYSQCTYNVTLRCVPATIVALERLLRILSLCLYPYVSSLQCACAILLRDLPRCTTFFHIIS